MAIPVHLQALHLAAIEGSCIFLVQGLLTRHSGGRAYTVHEIRGGLVLVRFENGAWQCRSCQNKGVPFCHHAAGVALHDRALNGALKE